MLCKVVKRKRSRGRRAMDEPAEPAGNAAAKQMVDEPAGGAAKKKKKKKKQKPLAGADNAPLRRRIALARGGARATSSDAAHSEDWAHAFVAACTVAPAGAPPAAVPPTHAGSGPWLSGAPTVRDWDEPLTQATRAPNRAGQLGRHAVGGFQNHADFMDECTEQPGRPPSRPPKMLHAMPAARSAPGSASGTGATPSQAGLAQAIQATACLMQQTASRHSVASMDECPPRFLPPTPAPRGTLLPLGDSIEPTHGQAARWPHSDKSLQVMPGHQPRQEERLLRAAQEQGGQAMPALHGRQMHQAAHTAAASSTFFATSSLSSARDNRAPPRKAPPPQRQDSALWDKVNMNTSGLLDEALDSV